ncbi:MAG: RNA methyltransferase [Maribacter sp.]|nr:RNA methyltransferase [Maribacter sp.]
MVVKSQIKLIKSLQQKKYRTEHRMFVAEGIKTVRELLRSNFELYKIYLTDSNLLQNQTHQWELISESELKLMSSLKNPNGVLGVFYLPEAMPVDFTDWLVVLDGINDPGNLGTIIRLCDWFGIHHIVCSPNTVDCFNPKVLQATMGSISRVNVVYRDLPDFLSNVQAPIYGAFMHGDTICNKQVSQTGILVMGNEAKGISKEVEVLVDEKISIPQFGKETTESLNVATATAILLHEIRRDRMANLTRT